MLSVDTAGELEPGSYSITLTAEEDVCMQTTSCITPLAVLPFIATKAPTVRRRPVPKPRVKPRGERTNKKNANPHFQPTQLVLLSSGKWENKRLPKGMWKGGKKYWKKGMSKSLSTGKSTMKGKSSMSKKSEKKYRGYRKGKGKDPNSRLETQKSRCLRSHHKFCSHS